MKRALSMNILILVLVGWTTSALAYDLASYFKILKPGAQWQYKEKHYADGQNPDSVAWEDSLHHFFMVPEQRDGKLLHQEWEAYCISGTQAISQVMDYEAWSYDLGRLYFYKFSEPGKTCNASPIFSMPRYAEVGDSVALASAFSCSDGGSGSLSADMSILGEEDVTVGAGVFTSCLKIVTTGDDNETAWYAKDVGKVKSLRYDSANSIWTLEELESYYIPPMQGDVNGDGKVGLPEAVNALQTCVGFRQDDAYSGIRQTLDRFEAVMNKANPSADDPDWDDVYSENHLDYGRTKEYAINFTLSNMGGANIAFDHVVIVEEVEGPPQKVRILGDIIINGTMRVYGSHLWLANENGIWRIIGDGYPLWFKMYVNTSWGQHNQSLEYNGIYFQVSDYFGETQARSIDNVLLTGPGLPQQGLEMRVFRNDPDHVQYAIYLNGQDCSNYGENQGLDISAIPYKAIYTFTPRDAAGNSVYGKSFTKMLLGPPMESAVLSANPYQYFAKVTSPDSGAFQAFSGGNLSVQWDAPTNGGSPMQIELEWFLGGNRHYEDGDLLRGTTAWTFEGVDASIGSADWKGLSIEVCDDYDRRFHSGYDF